MTGVDMDEFLEVGNILVINVYRENVRFLIHFNSQEEFMTAVDMDEFLVVSQVR